MKIREDFLYYSRPYITEKEIDAVSDVLRSGWWTTGKVSNELEKMFCDRVGAKYAVAVNSCTAALELSLCCNGIGAGDEVITTPMTFCSTAHSVIRCGGTPVFADICEDTGLIDPASVERAITPKTKAILPVHYAGQACDMDALCKIASKYSLKIIEDAAHALGTEYDGKPVGAIGDSTAFSFYVTKNIATGEGGMLTTDNEDIAILARKLSLHGMNHDAWNRYGDHGSWYYEVDECGYKFNFPDILAALGVEQLKLLDEMQAKREQLADIYRESLEGVQGISCLKNAPKSKSSEHLFVIKVDDGVLDIGRDEFIKELSEYKIGTSVHFIPVHLHPYYRRTFGTKEGMFPVCEKFFSQIISVPLYPSMSEEDVRYVSDAVREIAEKHRK